MSDWRLLLTRPAEESQILAATLAAHGVFSSSLPLLAIEPLAETPEQRAVLQQLQHYTAVIVVSKPAARLLCQRLPQGWSQPAAQQWLAVGTRRACRECQLAGDRRRQRRAAATPVVAGGPADCAAAGADRQR